MISRIPDDRNSRNAPKWAQSAESRAQIGSGVVLDCIDS